MPINQWGETPNATRALLIGAKFDEDLLAQLHDQLHCDLDICLSASAGLTRAIDLPPDVIMISNSSGNDAMLQLCRSLRSITATAALPIACLWDGLANAEDRLAALEAGADEIIMLPLDQRESLLRLASISRRTRRQTDETEMLVYGDIKMDLKSHKVWRNGILLDLTQKPFQLLHHLLCNPTRIFLRQELITQLWGGQPIDEGAVTACMARIRRALSKGGGPEVIRSINGGYALDYEQGHQKARGTLRTKVATTTQKSRKCNKNLI